MTRRMKQIVVGTAGFVGLLALMALWIFGTAVFSNPAQAYNTQTSGEVRHG